jgi:acetylornithine deacetylase/succinyl-diaminopimelate desuccinylase-like protein
MPTLRRPDISSSGMHSADLDVTVDEMGNIFGRREGPQPMSGAGHDAQELAAIAPTGMIFVRGPRDGISHNPRDYSTLEDRAAGVAVPAAAVEELATR